MGLISNNILIIKLHYKFWAVNICAYIIILEMSAMSLTFVLQAASKQHLYLIYSSTYRIGQMT